MIGGRALTNQFWGATLPELSEWSAIPRKVTPVLAAIAVLALPIPVTMLGASAPQGGAQVGGSSTNLQFDVVSIKPTKIDRPMDAMEDVVMGTDEVVPGGRRYRLQGVPARALIQAAYKVRGYQIDGAPAWVSSARYNVEAIAPNVATRDEMRAMLRSLLVDRFKLLLRRETQQGRVIELVPMKGGLKVMPMQAGGCIAMDSPDAARELVPFSASIPNVCGAYRYSIVSQEPSLIRRIQVVGAPMSQIAEVLSREVGRSIVDRTGVTEKFSFTLDYEADRLSDGPGGAAREPRGLGADVSAPLFGDAIKEQLGLELKTGTGPVEVLRIERIERPSEN
jgi:uncharacterized protein (TIGR03435 family)